MTLAESCDCNTRRESRNQEIRVVVVKELVIRAKNILGFVLVETGRGLDLKKGTTKKKR